MVARRNRFRASPVVGTSPLPHCQRTMRRMFQVAEEKQKILANPCERVHPPKVPKTEMTFLTWDQAINLAEAHTERFQATVYLAVDSGMRYFFTLYRFRVDEWALYDNDDGGPVIIASGDRGSGREDVLDPVAFAALEVKAGVPTGSKDGRDWSSEQAQVTDVVASNEDWLARHLKWERAMQEAVARALDEHRANGHSIAVLRDGKVVTLTPSQY